MTDKQKKEIDRQVWINRIKRKLGIDVPPMHHGDPLPSWWAEEEAKRSNGTKYRGMDGISVRIK